MPYHLRFSLIAQPGPIAGLAARTPPLLPPDLFGLLPSHSPLPLVSPSLPAPEPRSSPDSRLGHIIIHWFDMGSPVSPPKAHSHAAPKGCFVPLGTDYSSGHAHIGFGVLRLFRDSADLVKEKSSSQNNHLDDVDTPNEHCIAAVLAVPSYMTPSDFLGFVGEEAQKNVSHFRMIRTVDRNRYMVLIKFRRHKPARMFCQAYNGRLFNSMEPENCHVVFIKSVEFEVSAEKPSQFQYLANDPFSPSVESSSAIKGLATSIRPIPPPTPALHELPTCPVCLERMDSSITGLLTILCQHTFHCTCLSKWADSSCPVCRYSQKVSTIKRDEADYSVCTECNGVSNLWICLICGHIGCGRYDSAHAYTHFLHTSHLYAMDLESQRVWDYAGDGYVHRLIQNKADGKLVELPAGSQSDPPDTGGTDFVPRDKIDAIGIEYTHLLTSQLESQRVYYEDKITIAADKAAQAAERAQKALLEVDRLRSDYDRICLEKQEISNIILPELERNTNRAIIKSEKLTAMAKNLENRWHEEKSINQGIMKRLEHVQKEKATLAEQQKEKDTELSDLREQVRDLTFFLSARDKLAENPEAAEGTVIISQPASRKPKKKK
ncbi:RING finger protein ETP1 [Neolecta irregularis DAH-3]|uniref:RING finger protein ETP1 n=1 Tax=Neolecta irregularis (strain DAH-3) TaxID=1198029 RepID=A0A1U7LMS6_NEOID|nr:RING finger protein ETP1 [Neolecta irregularis DAH-3]|eukprot:OLL23883.1 RING finger protein ETP1 [Neolecta irregularis DAH-3]